jgi:hypothetical protein
LNIVPGTGSGGGALGDERLSCAVSQGQIFQNYLLRNIRLQNTRTTGNITMTGIKISANQTRSLTGMTFGGESRLASAVEVNATPQLLPFRTNFFMNSGTTYSGTTGGNLTFATSNQSGFSVTIIFVFFDGTETAAYTWS